MPWLLILIPFLLLRLGSILQINGELYPGVLLPKYYLNKLFPAMFQAVYATDHFQIGVILPLSVLSCYGLSVLLNSLSKKQGSALVVIAATFVAFEYYQVPQGQVVSHHELSHNTWLKNEPDQQEIRLINLPMGRRDAKLYGFYQTVNGYPHAEGVAMRTPKASYDYILQNPMLAAWQRHEHYACTAEAPDEYLRASVGLIDDGFSHVILHVLQGNAETVSNSFIDIPPAYQDELCNYLSRARPARCLRESRESLQTLPKPVSSLVRFRALTAE